MMATWISLGGHFLKCQDFQYFCVSAKFAP
jgi:hypothetical protein